jgi:hypothetical protein
MLDVSLTDELVRCYQGVSDKLRCWSRKVLQTGDKVSQIQGAGRKGADFAQSQVAVCDYEEELSFGVFSHCL